MDIIIQTLSEEFLRKHISTFIELLKNEPNEYWNKTHFLKELPRKFFYSQTVLFDKKIIGYLIASQKKDSVYVHKLMVHQSYRSLGIGKQLMDRLSLLAKNR